MRVPLQPPRLAGWRAEGSGPSALTAVHLVFFRFKFFCSSLHTRLYTEALLIGAHSLRNSVHRQRAPPHMRTRQVSPHSLQSVRSLSLATAHAALFLAAGRRPAASLSRPHDTSCPALAPAPAHVRAACSSSGLSWLLRLAQHQPLPSPPAPSHQPLCRAMGVRAELARNPLPTNFLLQPCRQTSCWYTRP